MFAATISTTQTTTAAAPVTDAPMLCLRGTFIDETSEEQLAETARLRSRSAPASAASHRGSASAAAGREKVEADAEADAFAVERAYVGRVSEKLRAGDLAQSLRAEQCNGMFSSWLLETKKTGSNNSVGTDSAAETGDCEVATTLEPLSDTTQYSSSETGSGSGSPVGASSDLGSKDNNNVGNIGSLGHPYLCSRPCLYFMSGQCANGAACDYCHLPHSKRPAHLEKKHREVLRDMPTSRALELALPIMREKVVSFDDSPESLAALARLAAACGVSERALGRSGLRSARLARSERSLAPALCGMSLRLLLFTLQKGMLSEHDTKAQEAADALLAQLRRNAAARAAASASGSVAVRRS